MLNMKSISITFNEGTLDEKRALQNVSLDMKKGDFVTVIGSNGAGKSTLMNMISGSIKPDVGTVEINDQNVTMLPEYKRSQYIGRVFQDPMAGTAPTMTIEENLAMAYAEINSARLKLGLVKREKKCLKSI
ncbi:methionine ABC transporter ATP-binding protein [Gracilibacillus boraciitolerans JCM 21714]|uniref:Methionine ABC transporter ATP-binding protein n=1 Tax=Gracilibacillus boraciitolerans JCM 21714 TaxID=1298598 RepID=W4VKX5_9BACI|nr:methionine ABC transporter ATP-binding protein [Gracilibacillus boraciitolerans JCM 21714]